MKYKLFSVLLAVVSALIIFGACSNLNLIQTNSSAITSSSNSNTGSKLFDTAPDFQLNDLEGNTISLTDYRGSPVIVHFWRIN